jgi:predicted DNA-binding WGR domain protein
VTVRFGRIGAAGQVKTKTHASDEEARADVERLVREKQRKGYRELEGDAIGARARAMLDALVEASAALASADRVFMAATLNAGATAAALAAVEQHLGRPLPSALRAMLTLADGAPRLLLWGDLFSTGDMLPGSMAQERLAELQGTTVTHDDVEAPLVPAGVLGISDKGDRQPDCVYLDPRGVPDGAEWPVVRFDHELGDTRFQDLFTYLEHVLETMRLLTAEASRPRPTARTVPTPNKEADRPLLFDAAGRRLR